MPRFGFNDDENSDRQGPPVLVNGPYQVRTRAVNQGRSGIYVSFERIEIGDS